LQSFHHRVDRPGNLGQHLRHGAGHSGIFLVHETQNVGGWERTDLRGARVFLFSWRDGISDFRHYYQGI
jgi:hypothetical protein